MIRQLRLGYRVEPAILHHPTWHEDFRPWAKNSELLLPSPLRRSGWWTITDQTRWIKPHYDFFLPVRCSALSFAASSASIRCAFHEGRLNFRGDLGSSLNPKIFAAWLRPLFVRTGSSTQNDRLEALSMYSISGPLHPSSGHLNHRLISFADGEITFRWRDSAHRNEQKLLYLFLSMSSCAAFCYTSCGSYASVISASWPIADVPPLATLLSVARLGATSHARNRHFQRCMALSQVRWADAGHRNVYNC